MTAAAKVPTSIGVPSKEIEEKPVPKDGHEKKPGIPEPEDVKEPMEAGLYSLGSFQDDFSLISMIFHIFSGS